MSSKNRYNLERDCQYKQHTLLRAHSRGILSRTQSIIDLAQDAYQRLTLNAAVSLSEAAMLHYHYTVFFSCSLLTNFLIFVWIGLPADSKNIMLLTHYVIVHVSSCLCPWFDLKNKLDTCDRCKAFHKSETTPAFCVFFYNFARSFSTPKKRHPVYV